MRNRKSTSVLIALVLAASMCVALGSEAQAGGKSSRLSSRVIAGSTALKPVVTPMAGEPDSPNGSPLPPKVGPAPTSALSSVWATRVQWSVRAWLDLLQKRFPW